MNGFLNHGFINKLLIFGANDFSEILYKSIKMDTAVTTQGAIAFVVDDEYWTQEYFCGEKVYKYSELKKGFSGDEIEILVTVGYSNMNQNRKKIFQRLLQDGWRIASYVDPCAVVRSDLFGIGNIVMDGVNIGVGCRLGDGNIFFSGSTLAHHCEVGDFNFFALRSAVAGRVKIGNDCFFGNNCCTKDHISIADQTLVGAGCYLDSDAVSSGGGICTCKMHKMQKKQHGNHVVEHDGLCIAILVSAGGSIFRKALEILRDCGSKVKFVMISDRVCNAEQIAEDYGLPLYKLYNKSKTEFSLGCKKYLDGFERIDAVMTFVWRLITKELIDAYPCVNIHPALLPAFKGFGAVKQAYESSVKFFGSTLHMVDEEMDHGPIIAQIQTPRHEGITLEEMMESAFVQDVYLMLLFVDMMERGIIKIAPHFGFSIVGKTIFDDKCNPLMENEGYAAEVRQMQKSRQIKIIR